MLPPPVAPLNLRTHGIDLFHPCAQARRDHIQRQPMHTPPALGDAAAKRSHAVAASARANTGVCVRQCTHTCTITRARTNARARRSARSRSCSSCSTRRIFACTLRSSALPHTRQIDPRPTHQPTHPNPKATTAHTATRVVRESPNATQQSRRASHGSSAALRAAMVAALAQRQRRQQAATYAMQHATYHMHHRPIARCRMLQGIWCMVYVASCMLLPAVRAERRGHAALGNDHHPQHRTRLWRDRPRALRPSRHGTAASQRLHRRELLRTQSESKTVWAGTRLFAATPRAKQHRRQRAGAVQRGAVFDTASTGVMQACRNVSRTASFHAATATTRTAKHQPQARAGGVPCSD